MEIRINTEKDSHKQIKKAISFLQNIINEENIQADNTNSNQENGFFGMFNDDDSNNIDNSSDQSPMLNIFDDNSQNQEETEEFSINDALSKNEDISEDEDNSEKISIIPY